MKGAEDSGKRRNGPAKRREEGSKREKDGERGRTRRGIGQVASFTLLCLRPPASHVSRLSGFVPGDSNSAMRRVASAASKLGARLYAQKARARENRQMTEQPSNPP